MSKIFSKITFLVLALAVVSAFAACTKEVEVIKEV